MQSCIPFSRVYARAPLLAAALIVALASCREDQQSPTAPESDPALATTTSALSFRQVSAGDIHSCGVTTNNRAYCWGWNVFGQVGNGSTNFDQQTPALVKGGLQFRQVSPGAYHTCGITIDYLAYCWGNGHLTPVAVPGAHLFRQVSAGPEHTCAVTTDDRAFCWGLNVFGQFGDGTNQPQDNATSMPVAVAGTLQFRHVSVGTYHSCGVTTANRAYCWGGDQWGQIGDGSSTGNCLYSGHYLPCRKMPTLVAGGYRFRQIDAGGGGGPGEGGEGGDDGGRTCAVATDDRAFCWGDGRHGQNGNGTQSIISSPQLVSGGLHFRNVSAGIYHTCGTTMDDLGYCWGWNEFGQLGDGTVTKRLRPRAVVGGHLFRQVSAGGAHTCGTTLSSVAYCWGSNSAGELGDGTNNTRLKPRAVVGP
jgi:alpha-tubulin suppressor-like RCC1 family protein